MRIPFYNNKKSVLLVISIVLMMCSCKDSEIAKDMEGTWKRSYVTSYEDGTKSHVDEQISFQYDASDNEKDGGTFMEMCTGQEEADEDEINAKYRWVSKIEGTWKIEFGTLYQHYNLSTLEVEIGKDDVDLKIKDEAWLWNDWGDLLTAGIYAKQTIYENLKKETYKELFRSYKRLNNQTCQDIGFPNVQINGSVMSYETGDMGKVKFYRLKEKKTLMRTKVKEKEAINENYDEDKEDDDYTQNVDYSDYSLHLLGYVDSYEINMYININDDGDASGLYYYSSQGSDKPIYLTGQCSQKNRDAQLVLRGNNQDVFDGCFDGESYSGEFNNINNNKLSFELYIVKTNN